ncbi:hypothetical protein [Massilia niastensis]|uniref:hypothetical protein n=1 Tax=Massilia niastensis TaxID=544911 RepID=UPI0003A5529B|nr:hypothetical protein [Massilia niastensis]
MKRRHAPLNLGMRFHGPLRFGRRWRGHERVLRIGQMILFICLAVAVSRLVADAITLGAGALGRMLS